MAKIDVARLAVLAHLELTEQEQIAMRAEMASILKAVEALQDVETEGVEPLHHAVELTNRMRTDDCLSSLPQERVLANGPHVVQGFFRVPRILGDS